MGTTGPQMKAVYAVEELKLMLFAIMVSSQVAE